MSRPRILVAGIGNVFLGDDGFGVEVVRRLASRGLADGVTVADFGIRGLDLAYALLDGYAAAVLVDAMPRGGAPGTLYAIEPDLDPMPAACLADTHRLDPASVLAFARALGGELPVLRVIGCEPTAVSEDAMVVGLSEPVAAAADAAVTLVESVVADLHREALARA